MLDLDKLKAIAEKATPAPWIHLKENPKDPSCTNHFVQASHSGTRGLSVAQYASKADARFIAAFNPTTVRTLIERAQQAEARENAARIEDCQQSAAAFNHRGRSSAGDMAELAACMADLTIEELESADEALMLSAYFHSSVRNALNALIAVKRAQEKGE